MEISDFIQRKSDYIQRKSDIVKQLQGLQTKQDELLSQLATLKKPKKEPPRWEELSLHQQQLQGLERAKGGSSREIISNRIVIKAGGVTWSEPIDPTKIEQVQELQIEQGHLFAKIINPKYKSKEESEYQAKRIARWGDYGDYDEDSW